MESLTNTVLEFKLSKKRLAAQPEAFPPDAGLLKQQELPETPGQDKLGREQKLLKQNRSHLTHAILFFWLSELTPTGSYKTLFIANVKHYN